MTALFVVEEWRFIAELICGEFIFLPPSARRRSRFALRCAGGFVFCLAFSLLYYFIAILGYHGPLTNAIHITWYCLLVVLSLSYIVFCYRISFGWLLFCGIGGYALQHIEYVAVNEMFALGVFPQITENLGAYIALIVFSYAVVCTVAALLFRPKLHSVGDLKFAAKPISHVFYCLLLAMFIASAFMAQIMFMNGQMRNEVTNPNYVAGVADIFNCVFVLVIMYASCSVRERDRRNDISITCSTTPRGSTP